MSLKGFYMSPTDFTELEVVEAEIIAMRSRAHVIRGVGQGEDSLTIILRRLQAVLNRSSCRVRSAEIKRHKYAAKRRTDGSG